MYAIVGAALSNTARPCTKSPAPTVYTLVDTLLATSTAQMSDESLYNQMPPGDTPRLRKSPDPPVTPNPVSFRVKVCVTAMPVVSCTTGTAVVGLMNASTGGWLTARKPVISPVASYSASTGWSWFGVDWPITDWISAIGAVVAPIEASTATN